MWIKICGMTDAAAVAAALAAQADALGFVFAPSVRALTPAAAAALAVAARGRCALVAVTLHPSQSLVDEILRVLRPDVLQTDWRDLGALRLPQALQVLPVLRESETQPSATDLPPRVLYEGARSGSGRTVDWIEAAQLARRTDLVIAGGLGVQNVAQAICAVRPYGVDVSSGVEQAPGRKSPGLIEQFVGAVRSAAREVL